MAGDWIPIRLDLPDDPAVITMAAMLDMAEDDVVGRLVRTWAWFNKHTRTGHAKSVTKAWLDRYTSTPGWSDAMESAGWLEVSDDGLAVPDYKRWNDKAAAIRLKANERKKKQRANEKEEPAQSRKPSRDSHTPCHTESVTDPGPQKRREEKRREEDDLLCSWKEKLVKATQLKDWCVETFLRPSDGSGVVFSLDHLNEHPDTRRLLLQVGVLRLCGAISEACVQDGCEAIRKTEKWPANPGGYLRTVWGSSKHAPTGAGADWFAELLAEVELPDDI